MRSNIGETAPQQQPRARRARDEACRRRPPSGATIAIRPLSGRSTGRGQPSPVPARPALLLAPVPL